MRKCLLFACLFILAALPLHSVETTLPDTDESSAAGVLPVRGLAIEAPKPQGVERFLGFIEEELAPAHFNLLILRVDWNYAYETHPELHDRNPLTRDEVRRIVAVCKKHGIRLVPQINLLGHQSWA
ncbi:MAG: glycoside hydrolase, partial [Bacteroidales bacterium]|nr:glycoside hydrolase [Bacteroidales bacterium]